MKYCDKDKDPSLGIRRKTPAARSDIWHEGEAVRLIKQAWREGYRGLAAAMAVIWDTQLSPVDVRSLTAAQRTKDVQGAVFFQDRTKTGRAAAGTPSRRAELLLDSRSYYVARGAPFISSVWPQSVAPVRGCLCLQRIDFLIPPDSNSISARSRASNQCCDRCSRSI
jgi:hypothetical protein